jgi:hypothetical protein
MSLETREQLEKFLLKIYDNDPYLQELVELLKLAGNKKDISELRSLLSLTKENYDEDNVLGSSFQEMSRVEFDEVGKYFDLYVVEHIQNIPHTNKYQCKINNDIVEIPREKYLPMREETIKRIEEKLKEKLDTFVGENGCYVIHCYNTYFDIFTLTKNNVVFDLLEDNASKLDYLLK